MRQRKIKEEGDGSSGCGGRQEACGEKVSAEELAARRRPMRSNLLSLVFSIAGEEGGQDSGDEKKRGGGDQLQTRKR